APLLGAPERRFLRRLAAEQPPWSPGTGARDAAAPASVRGPVVTGSRGTAGGRAPRSRAALNAVGRGALKAQDAPGAPRGPRQTGAPPAGVGRCATYTCRARRSQRSLSRGPCSSTMGP